MEYVKTTMIDSLLNFISPHRCSSCGEIGSILCESCKHDIISEPFLDCVLCTVPCGKRGVCDGCARVTGIEQAWCVAERQGGLKNLLDGYKFESKRAASTACVELLDAVIPALPPDITVVSIPSAPSTVRARGFDHMGRIAEGFVAQRSLRRAKPLERASPVTLHFLSAAQRKKLGPTLFRMSENSVPEQILLLDDIVTTGTTFRAAAKLLRGAGVKKIYLAAIARQPLH